jgi:hypothetical protein
MLFTLLTHTASPQGARLGQPCDLSALGAKDTGSFLAFDHELRAAISKQGVVSIALGMLAFFGPKSELLLDSLEDREPPPRIVVPTHLRPVVSDACVNLGYTARMVF